jgi:hypothetical protein
VLNVQYQLLETIAVAITLKSCTLSFNKAVDDAQLKLIPKFLAIVKFISEIDILHREAFSSICPVLQVIDI